MLRTHEEMSLVEYVSSFDKAFVMEYNGMKVKKLSLKHLEKTV
jgi:hypothetical protein